MPPHLLDNLAQSEDPALAEKARRTLERDALERTHRRLTTVIGAPSLAPPKGAAADKPHRTIHDAKHKQACPARRSAARATSPARTPPSTARTPASARPSTCS